MPYKISLSEKRRKGLKKRIWTNLGKINEMLNLHQNYITLKEEGMHFDDTFEMLIEVHEEMLELLGGSNEAAWFGEEVFAFRHKSTIG